MGNPRYAVVKLKEGSDTVELYSLLVQHGYLEVSFVERLRDAPQYDEQCSSSSPNSSSQVSKKRRIVDACNSDPDATSESSSPAPLYEVSDLKTEDNLSDKHPALISALQQTQTPMSLFEFDGASNGNGGDDDESSSSLALEKLYEEYAKRESASPVASDDNDCLFDADRTSSSKWDNSPTSTSAAVLADDVSGSSPQQEVKFLDDGGQHSIRNEKATATPIVNYMDSMGNPTEAQLLLLKINQAFDMKPILDNSITSTQNDRLKSPAASEEEPVECKKCHVKLKISRMHCIRYHLAMHWPQKQFGCSRCTHSSHLNGNVKLHIKSNHAEGADIMEQVSDAMVDGWCMLAEECFPQHSSKVIRLLRLRQQERSHLAGKRIKVDRVPARTPGVDTGRSIAAAALSSTKLSPKIVARPVSGVNIVMKYGYRNSSTSLQMPTLVGQLNRRPAPNVNISTVSSMRPVKMEE